MGPFAIYGRLRGPLGVITGLIYMTPLGPLGHVCQIWLLKAHVSVEASCARVQVITKQMLLSRASSGSEVSWKRRKVDTVDPIAVAAVPPVVNAAGESDSACKYG